MRSSWIGHVCCHASWHCGYDSAEIFHVGSQTRIKINSEARSRGIVCEQELADHADISDKDALDHRGI